MHLFEPVADEELQLPPRFGDPRVRRYRLSLLRDLQKDEVIVVRKADHHSRGADRARVEEIVHGPRGGLQHLIELLPAVDLLDLRVAHEVQIVNDHLAAILDQPAHALEHHRKCGHAREGIVEHLLVLHSVDAMREAEARRGDACEGGANAPRDLFRRRGRQVPVVDTELDRAAIRDVVPAREHHGDATRARVLDDRAQQRRIIGGDYDRACGRMGIDRRRKARCRVYEDDVELQDLGCIRESPVGAVGEQKGAWGRGHACGVTSARFRRTRSSRSGRSMGFVM